MSMAAFIFYCMFLILFLIGISQLFGLPESFRDEEIDTSKAWKELNQKNQNELDSNNR